jgi:fructosamine-3-kinase
VRAGLTQRLEAAAGAKVRAAIPLGGQHGVTHYRLELGDGRAAFAKAGAASDAAGFAAEAASLYWLAEAGAVAVPEVLGWDDAVLVLAWVPEGGADPAAAALFGRELAALHLAGADSFGAPWPGVIAGLPLPNDPPPGGGPASGGELAQSGTAAQPGAAGAGWAQWYAAARVLPYLRMARDAGTLSARQASVIEAAAAHAAAVAGPAEPPARIHGDLWSGNLLWSDGRCWLVDPAAHGGHRETDLAMLDLFGAPYLAEIIAGYTECAPLADGWRARVPLHQLHPLLVHVCLFGGGYAAAAVRAASAVLAL